MMYSIQENIILKILHQVERILAIYQIRHTREEFVKSP